MTFAPVTTPEELDALPTSEVVAGFVSGIIGEPEPTLEDGRARWHGWRNAMVDCGLREPDAAYVELARALDERQAVATQEAVIQ